MSGMWTYDSSETSNPTSPTPLSLLPCPFRSPKANPLTHLSLAPSTTPTTPPQVPPEPLEGKFYYDDATTYTGQFVYVLNDGETDVPAGETRPRKRHGKGTLTEGNARYVGDWVNDAMHGEGTFTFPSGATYTGEFQNNQFSGRGKYVWSDGRVYEGQWEENLMHGKGVYTDHKGHAWTGQFYNGVGPGLDLRIDRF